MTRLAAALLILLTGCDSPQIGANIVFGPKGAAIRPQVSGQIGGVTVGVSSPAIR